MGDTRLDRLWWGPLAPLPWREQNRIAELVRQRQPVVDHRQAQLALAFAHHSRRRATWMAGVFLVLGLGLITTDLLGHSSIPVGGFIVGAGYLILSVGWSVRAWRMHRFGILSRTAVVES